MSDSILENMEKTTAIMREAREVAVLAGQEIERLRTINAQLAEALQDWVDYYDDQRRRHPHVIRIARSKEAIAAQDKEEVVTDTIASDVETFARVGAEEFYQSVIAALADAKAGKDYSVVYAILELRTRLHRAENALETSLSGQALIAHDETVAAMEDLAKKCEAEIVQLKLAHETSDLPRHHFTWLQLERFLKAIRAAIPLPPETVKP